MSLIDIINENNEVKDSPGRIFGVVTGIVTNIEDPDEMGRVKVMIPRLTGQDDESHWARIATLMAGPEMGAFFLPEVDDEVLLAFEYGDISMPYVIGSLWNGKDAPPETNSDGDNNIRVIKSRSGHKIELNDEDGAEKIHIQASGEKDEIIIDVAENTITIQADVEIKLISSDGKITIDAKEGEFTFSDALNITAKELNIETDAAVNVTGGADIVLEASGNLDAKGATINLN